MQWMDGLWLRRHGRDGGMELHFDRLKVAPYLALQQIEIRYN